MPIQNGVCTGHRMKFNPDGTCLYKPPFYFTTGKEKFSASECWEGNRFSFIFKYKHRQPWWFEFIDSKDTLIFEINNGGESANPNPLPWIEPTDQLNINSQNTWHPQCGELR